MRKITHLNSSKKTQEANQTFSKSYCQGVTQRLLDKYKPSREFKVIVGKNHKNNGPKAA